MTSTKQKHLFAGVLENKRCEEFCKTHKETPMSECLFNKVLGFRPVAFLMTDPETGGFM